MPCSLAANRGDRCLCLASKMCVVSVFCYVAFELVFEAVRALENRGLPSHPKRPTQPGVSTF